VVAGDAGGWVEDWLSPALGRPPLIRVELPARAGDHWGVTHVVEAVEYPLAVEELGARLARRLAVRRCAWCGEAIASRPCPFCRAGAPDRDSEVAS
jgi:hypothetical protein